MCEGTQIESEFIVHQHGVYRVGVSNSYKVRDTRGKTIRWVLRASPAFLMVPKRFLARCAGESYRAKGPNHPAGIARRRGNWIGLYQKETEGITLRIPLTGT